MAVKFDKDQIKLFWEQHNRFLKSTLITEAPNPLTQDLANLCKTDINAAFELFKAVELQAIEQLKPHIASIKSLQNAIASCLKRNANIYLMGCGASGRLAMLLKRLWQQSPNNNPSQVISVSAGGDISLIKAVEQFEDNGQFGIKQLLSQGFDPNYDLLIGLSASGESPFITSAIEFAAHNSNYKPYIIFNNSAASILERNPNNIIGAEQIHSISLNVGPMALTGSTRLSATTAMQIAVGMAMGTNPDIENFLKGIADSIIKLPLSQIAKITNLEATALKQNQFILYSTSNMLLGLNLLADITERSPTFNLPSFENEYNSSIKPCPFYLAIENIGDKEQIWPFLFGQSPYCLNWDNYPTTLSSYMEKFDLSYQSPRVSGNYLGHKQHVSKWSLNEDNLNINFNNTTVEFNLPNCDLIQTIIFKICLNAHSTILFGILGYYDGNMMLSLKPSNFKLIDRAIRYARFILNNKYHLNISYKEVAEITFEQINQLNEGQSIVKNVVNSFLEFKKL